MLLEPIDSPGYCNTAGQCLTTCGELPLQSRSELLSCKSVQCVRPGVCAINSNSATIQMVADLCFVADEVNFEYASAVILLFVFFFFSKLV